MGPRAWRPKAAALLFAGSLAVHELRYVVAYGPGAGHAEATQGHAYLTLLAPAVASAAVLALAAWLVRLAAGRAGPDGESPIPGFRRLWGGMSALLIALFVVQETLEGLTSADHPAGVAGVLGHGGWTALVLAVAVGAVLALALRAAGVALAPPGRAAETLRPVVPAASSFLIATAVARTRPHPLASFLAGRGPPPTSA
jgi:hypothetical protein